MNRTIVTTLVTCIGALALNGCGTDVAPSALPTTSTTDTLTQQGYSAPAEWERQDAVWLAWWVQPYGGEQYPTQNASVEMLQAITNTVPVNLMVQPGEGPEVRAILRRANVNLARVRFVDIEHSDFWVRDTGGVFSRNNRGEVGVLDFGYNFWGYDEYTSTFSQADERIDRDVARSVGVPAYRCSLIHEGGNTEVDGHGTAIVTEAVVRQRNPHMTLSEAEREIRRCYGVRQVIWLPEGLLEDQAVFRGALPGGVFTAGGTNGHTDAFVRFAPNNVVLLAEVTRDDLNQGDSGARERALVNRQRLDDAYRIIRSARDADGRPYRVVRVPIAEPDYYDLLPTDPFYGLYPAMSPLEDGTVINDGDPVRVVSTTSYLNFFVTNGQVLVPAYGRALNTPRAAAKDAEVERIIRAAFPGRAYTPLHWAIASNRGAGGPHCMTQQQPASTNAVTPSASP